MKGEAAITVKLESFNSVCISPIVLAELYFGAYRSGNPLKHLKSIAIVIKNAKLLAIDAATAETFVAIKLALLTKGKPIPENDIWIAATALQHQLPLYSNDGHFAQVEGLMLI